MGNQCFRIYFTSLLTKPHQHESQSHLMNIQHFLAIILWARGHESVRNRIRLHLYVTWLPIYRAVGCTCRVVELSSLSLSMTIILLTVYRTFISMKGKIAHASAWKWDGKYRESHLQLTRECTLLKEGFPFDSMELLFECFFRFEIRLQFNLWGVCPTFGQQHF